MRGLLIALQQASLLPTFADEKEAQGSLGGMRDACLAWFEAASGYVEVSLDYSPESLKRLEAWYFELVETEGFGAFGVSRAQFENAMSFYFGAVAVKNAEQCRWVINESVFAPGHYEIGIEQGLLTVYLLGRCEDWYLRPNNKRRQKLYREYHRWFVRWAVECLAFRGTA